MDVALQVVVFQDQGAVEVFFQKVLDVAIAIVPTGVERLDFPIHAVFKCLTSRVGSLIVVAFGGN